MHLSETEATELFLSSCKFRCVQRWKPQSLGVFFFLYIKNLLIAISKPSYFSEQELPCACVFRPVPQWLFSLTLAKQSASRYVFSSTILMPWDGGEWLWGCYILRESKASHSSFPLLTKIQNGIWSSPSSPRPVMDNFNQCSAVLCSTHRAQALCSLSATEARSKSQCGRGGVGRGHEALFKKRI